jgi:predicted ATPase/class 3 adenylate cyclase
MVTFVFTDIEGSTRLFRSLGDGYVKLLDQHHAVLRLAWSRYGGHEVRTEGDAFFVAFADAAAAIDACVDAQRALRVEEWPEGVEVRVRMGVHTGLAQPRDGDYVAYAVHEAARVVAVGHGGQVIVSGQAWTAASGRQASATRSLGRYRVRDFDDPVELFAVDCGENLEPRPMVRAVPADGHNLVRPRASFVGRESDCAELDEIVRAGMLVTVTGPGGVGKTRLVSEWGLAAAANWRDGVWFVELAPLSDGAAVVSAAAAALGVRLPPGANSVRDLSDAIGQRRAVLILDNCEHLAGEVARVAVDLLDACPDLAIVATSREPLAVQGELLWRLHPLAFDAPAVELFVDRSRSASRGWHLNPDDVDVIRRLCQRLDGLPLAIELAAACSSRLTPRQILSGLDDSFDHLRRRERDIPARHRTMDATLDWSWNLLDPDERAALRRLALFADTFDGRAAAAAIGWGELATADTTELLLSLIDRSLVVVDPTNSHRSRLLETVRADARRRLDASGETERVARALGQHYVERFGPHLIALDAPTISALSLEFDNFAQLIDELGRYDDEHALTLAYVLVRRRGANDVGRALHEGREILARFSTPTPARTALLAAVAGRATDIGALDVARIILSETADSDPAPPLWADQWLEHELGALAIIEGRPEEARAIGRAMLESARTTIGRTMALELLAVTELEFGLPAEAFAMVRQCVQLTREAGDLAALAIELGNAAECAWRADEPSAAVAYQAEALELALALGNQKIIAYSVILAARTASHKRSRLPPPTCLSSPSAPPRFSTPPANPQADDTSKTRATASRDAQSSREGGRRQLRSGPLIPLSRNAGRVRRDGGSGGRVRRAVDAASRSAQRRVGPVALASKSSTRFSMVISRRRPPLSSMMS